MEKAAPITTPESHSTVSSIWIWPMAMQSHYDLPLSHWCHCLFAEIRCVNPSNPRVASLRKSRLIADKVSGHSQLRIDPESSTKIVGENAIFAAVLRKIRLTECTTRPNPCAAATVSGLRIRFSLPCFPGANAPPVPFRVRSGTQGKEKNHVYRN